MNTILNIMIICVICLIIFIPFYIIGYKITERMMKETEQWFADFLKECHQNLYEMMSDLQHCFSKQDISYFITCGTLLGAVRGKSIIPHDDDIDIVVTEKDSKKLWSAEFKKELDTYGMTIYTNPQGIIKINKKQNKFDLFIDIFIVEEKDGKYTYTCDYCKFMWPKEYYFGKEIYPLKKYDFGPIKVWGPQNPIPFLERAYGQDWKIPKVCSNSHAFIILNKMKLGIKERTKIYLYILFVYIFKEKF